MSLKYSKKSGMTQLFQKSKDFLQSLKDSDRSDADTDEKVSEIFNIADRNRDGVIDFIEFFCRLPQILNWN